MYTVSTNKKLGCRIAAAALCFSCVQLGLPFDSDAQRDARRADFLVLGIATIIVVLFDFVVVSTRHQHADGEIALGGETHTEGQVAVSAHVVTDERAEAQADDRAHHLVVDEQIAQIGIERHQSAVFVEINAETHTGKDVAVEIKAVGGRQADAVGHILVEMPGVALFKETLIAAGDADLRLLVLSEHACCHQQHNQG